MRLCDIASYLGADLADNGLCTGFALDSRLVDPGNVFVCFKVPVLMVTIICLLLVSVGRSWLLLRLFNQIHYHSCA